jgi:uncharacterized protein
MEDRKIIPAAILGVALIISAFTFGKLYYSAQSVNSKDVLSVTGSAKTRVSSDQAKLIISLSREAVTPNLSPGYKSLAGDLAAAQAFLKKSGVADTDVVESPVTANQVYEQYPTAGVTHYQLGQTLTVQSNDISKVTEISKNVPSLANGGAIVSVQSLEYYYSKLPDLRVSLLTQAVQDAKSRAEKIAEGTGRKIGGIQTASSGVVQVLAPNSVDVSDYGSYDTSSIDKDVMVSVKASFRLE